MFNKFIPNQKGPNDQNCHNTPLIAERSPNLPMENPYYEEEGEPVAHSQTLESPGAIQSSSVVKISQNMYYETDDLFSTQDRKNDLSNKSSSSNVIKSVQNPYYQ